MITDQGDTANVISLAKYGDASTRRKRGVAATTRCDTRLVEIVDLAMTMGFWIGKRRGDRVDQHHAELATRIEDYTKVAGASRS